MGRSAERGAGNTRRPHRPYNSRCETGTAFGAARLQNPAAAGGGHASAKTVGTLAMNDAGLESPLHDDSLRDRSRQSLRFLAKSEKLLIWS